MTDDHLGFLTTLGRELDHALVELDLEFPPSGQDAFEIYREGLGEEPTVHVLRAMSSPQISRVRAACAHILESDDVTDAHIRTAVERTLDHWDRGEAE